MGADLTRRPRLLRGRPEGFSLIESILAMALFTTGCLAVAGMLTITDRAAATAAGWDGALALADEIVEQETGIPATALLSGDRNGDETVGRFRRRWRVRWDASTGLAGVAVEVDWSDRGRPHRLTLGLLRADPRRAGA